MAQAFIDAGVEPENVSGFNHILLNNLGDDRSDVTAQIHRLQMTVGDRLLLCTDGLSDLVADEDIARILQQDASSQDISDQLIGKALERGGKDNVTVVVATAVSQESSLGDVCSG